MQTNIVLHIFIGTFALVISLFFSLIDILFKFADAALAHFYVGASMLQIVIVMVISKNIAL